MFVIHPDVVQAIGIACIPRQAVDEDCPAWLARVPVAAAVVTIRRRDDGRCEVGAETMSDVRSQEFPLCWLLDQALDPAAITLIQPDDRNTLRIAMAGRRFFAETRLARLLTEPARMIDPAATWEGIRPSLRDVAKSLGVPTLENGIAGNRALWDRRLDAPLEERALGDAVLQAMIWSTLAASENAEPALYFEATLAIRTWLDGLPERSALQGWQMTRPILRATSYEQEYRADLERRARGEPRSWPAFRDGLFHT